MNFRKFFGHASDMAAIRSLMMRYKVAVDQGDIPGVMQCHAPVEDISAVSLDSAYYGRDQVQAFFEKLFSPTVREDTSRPPKVVYVAIHQDTTVLVLEHEMRLRRPQPQTLPCRVTFTLIRGEKDWRILHSHVSAPRSVFVDLHGSEH